MLALVTGSKGYIGSHVLKELKRRKIQHKEFEGDICDSVNVRVESEGCTHLIHLAAILGSPDFSENERVNAEGTDNLLFEGNFKRVIFTSTISAVRKKQGPYGLSKRRAERLVRASNSKYIIFRPTLVYGDRSRGLNTIIKNIERFPFVIPMVGTGSFLRQPIYVKDLAKLLVDALTNEKAINKTYNAGGEENITFSNLVVKVSALMGFNKILIPLPLFFCRFLGFLFETTMKKPIFTQEHVRSLSEDTKVDISELKKDFNFKFTSLDDGLMHTLADLKKL